MESPSDSTCGILPLELYLLVLDNLKLPDKTVQNSLTIFRLACCSSLLYNFINNWATQQVKKDLVIINELEKLDSVPLLRYPRNGLNIFCTQLAGICTLCPLRSNIEEFFTDVKLCDLCDLDYFPKISHTRLIAHYTISPTAKDAKPWEKIDCTYPCTRECSTHRCQSPGYGVYYRWQDIQQLVAKKELILRKAWHSCEYVGEEYGWFASPNVSHHQPDFWHNGSIWSDAGCRWDTEKCYFHMPSTLRPSTIEMMLLHEFRYRFDPTWRPRGTDQEDTLEYIRIARHWATERLWGQRPWKISNFPSQPRSLIACPCATAEDKAKVARQMKDYRSQSYRIRAVLKAFPNILRSPDMYCICSDIEDRELVVMTARDANVRWTEPILRKEMFRITKFDEKIDVQLVGHRKYNLVAQVDRVEMNGTKMSIVAERAIWL